MTDERAEERRRIAEEVDVREYTIRICDQCYRLEGESCNNPGCVFIRCTMDEVGRYLDQLMIRPVVNGERLDLRTPTSEPGGEGVALAVPWKLPVRALPNGSIFDADGLGVCGSSPEYAIALAATLNATPDPASADEHRALVAVAQAADRVRIYQRNAVPPEMIAAAVNVLDKRLDALRAVRGK